MGLHSASVREAGLRPESGSPSATDVRVGPLAPLASLLRDLGQDPAPVFGAFDLASDAFDDAERRLPFAVVAGVVQRAATLTRREDIGLLLGQRFQIDQFGLLGALMTRARTVGEALNDLYRFFHLQDRGGAAYLSRRGQSEVALGYSILGQPGPGLAVIHDLVIAIGMRLLRALSGRAFRAQEVFLQRSPPRAMAGYERFFAAPLRFDAPHSEIRFDAQWLQTVVAGGDASRHALAQQAALQAEAAVAQGIVERARAVAQVLLSGGTVSAPQVAAALGLHERTLRRRLAQQGARLQDLMSAARYQLARQLLQDTQLPLGAIAMALGYADAPAFVRAFRGWAGITPGAWRAGANPAR